MIGDIWKHTVEKSQKHTHIAPYISATKMMVKSEDRWKMMIGEDDSREAVKIVAYYICQLSQESVAGGFFACDIKN